MGNGPISYYYPTVLQGAGITNNHTRLLLNGFQTLISLSGALLGAAFTDKWGRRKQLLTSTALITLIFVAVTALNATNILTDPDTGLPVTDDSGTPIAISQTRSKGVIAVVFVFGFVYSAGFTPLQALYPVECLRYESRAKGMAMYNFFVNVANFYNVSFSPFQSYRICSDFFFRRLSPASPSRTWPGSTTSCSLRGTACSSSSSTSPTSRRSAARSKS